ncbi:amidohydrolase [Paracoccus jeotgali]|uniref:Amidohydrolase n=2 Tax=Paracoccus jeotgali TaxID=2065379 RepID=A0A2K9MIV1_9RHOB|nr:amidohydrolase [Paracoccus jeotgali]
MMDVAQQIWQNPELGYLETETAALLISELEGHGFLTEAGVGDMPTAFVARRGSGDGPVIAILAEMDALPGFSQAAVPHEEAVAGLSSGHACGHHLFGAGSVAAAIALADYAEAQGLAGEVRLYGTPAEEGGSGKAYLARSGALDDVDAVLHWHPGGSNSASQGASLSNVSAKFRYRGQAAHAALAPDQGRSALDALEATTFMINLMREHVPQEARIHYVISNGGAAPNVVPDFAELYLYVRHQDPAVVADIYARIQRAAEGAAMGTETEVEFERISGVYSVLPNDTLGRLMDQNLRAATPIEWDADETAFARELQATLRKQPDISEAFEIEDYDFGGVGYYSSDVGDVSWIAPTVGLSTATFVPGTPQHSWQAVAAGGMSIGHKGTAYAARALAATGAELLQTPELIDQAKAEFLNAWGEGFEYEALVGDRMPPLDYRVE